MNPRITIGLAVLLLALAAVYFFGGLPEPTPGLGVTGTPTPIPPEIIAYSTSEISQVAVRSGADTITLQKDGSGNWTYARGTLTAMPADNTRVNGVVMRLGNLKARGRVLESLSDAQKPEYGLAQPETQLTVGRESDSLTLLIGAQNPQRTGHYAQLAGAPALYLIESLLVDDLKRLVTQPPDPPTPTPVPTVSPTAATITTPGPTGTPAP